jgi:hypothetical protein
MFQMYASVFLATLLGSSTAWVNYPQETAQPPETKSDKKTVDEAAVEQEKLATQYRSFELAMLHLAQRLERSDKSGDRERAAILKEAIKKSSEVGISHKFETLIGLLRTTKAASITELSEAMTQSKMLADDIQAILDILLTDNREALLKKEIERIQRLKEELSKVIHRQKVVRVQTETGKLEKQSLATAQKQVRNATQKLAESMGKPRPDKKNGEKGEPDQSRSSGLSDKDNQSQQAPGRKQIQEAAESQKKAESEIAKNKKDVASNHQDQAIQKLEEAKKRLEELLRQLREEEKQRLLAALEARCRRMLELQTEVYQGTVEVEKVIAQDQDKIPDRSQEQRSLKLSDREMAIVQEAKKGLDVLEAEGSGVAFPEVFGQVRDDAAHVARRLGKVDVRKVTQAIELDIIASLKEMLEALKKAQSNSRGGSGSGSGSNGERRNKTLIDLLAELKMIRSLQLRVNQRTSVYGRQYPGEQAGDDDIQKELASLARRQQKIFELTNDIALGKNDVGQ